MKTKKIKLFESFQELPEFISKLDRSNNHVYDPPYMISEDFYVKDAKVKWKLEIEQNKWGYDLGTPQLTYLEFDYEYTLPESESTIEETIIATQEQLAQAQIKYEILSFPLNLESIEINMRHTIHPEDWKIEVIIGSKPE